MVEKFVGTWKMISSENFDDYMKAIGRTHELELNIYIYFKKHHFNLFIPCTGISSIINAFST